MRHCSLSIGTENKVYFATMNSFGYDQTCVGVTGIVGCMGIFVATNDLLYAVHVKAQNANQEALGAQKFGAFVKNCEGPGNTSSWKVFCMINGGNRLERLRDDLQPFVTCLGVKKVAAIRLYANLQTIMPSKIHSSLASVAVVLRRGAIQGQFDIRYMQDSTVNWLQGEQAGGKFRHGWYGNPSSKEVVSVDPNFPGWHTVVTSGPNANATLENLNF